MVNNSNTKISCSIIDGKVCLTSADMRANAKKFIPNPTDMTKRVLLEVSKAQEAKLGTTNTL